jgi:hypothetical protein
MIFKRCYLPTDALSRLIWLEQFAGKLPQYTTLLSITAAEITVLNSDAVVLRTIIGHTNSLEHEVKKRTAYKNVLIHGDPTEILGPFPTMAALTAPTVTSLAGIFPRADRIVERIKVSPNYTEAIGMDLGIEPLPATLMAAAPENCPDISGYLDGNHPVIKFAGLQRRNVDIYVERSEGAGFEYLMTTSYSTYTDMFAIPQGMNYAHWKYKAIYRSKTGQYGEFSKVIGISVIRETNN